jgi:hypothetical protein
VANKARAACMPIGVTLGDAHLRSLSGQVCVAAEGCDCCGWDTRLIQEAVGLEWRRMPAWFFEPFLVIDAGRESVVVAPRTHSACRLQNKGGEARRLWLPYIRIERYGRWGTCRHWPMRGEKGGFP